MNELLAKDGKPVTKEEIEAILLRQINPKQCYEKELAEEITDNIIMQMNEKQPYFLTLFHILLFTNLALVQTIERHIKYHFGIDFNVMNLISKIVNDILNKNKEEVTLTNCVICNDPLIIPKSKEQEVNLCGKCRKI